MEEISKERILHYAKIAHSLHYTKDNARIYANEAYGAMNFAMKAHKNQKRKYINEPYFMHLAEVAGLIGTISLCAYSAYENQYDVPIMEPEQLIAIAWLHDVLEDCNITMQELKKEFSHYVVEGVIALSDLEKGNRATRNQLSRERLAKQPKYIQDIKVCDIISNTSSIVTHDPNFAKVYLEEKRLLLECLTKADERLLKIAKEYV